MSNSKPLLALAATLAVASLAVTGCAQSSDPEPTDGGTNGQQDPSGFEVNTTVPYTDTEVTLSQGDVLEVDFGTINQSIGDEWSVTQQPDASVLVTTIRPGDPNATPVAPGSDTPFSLFYEAVGTGETSITFQYTYRGTETTPADGPGTTTLTVTVE